ncbi:MAG: glycosyltransferase family 2 protein, partial [Cytophagales bacterium]|nr:glycosyltransferase family 2 protein [Armatimonadota bacterium]
MRLTVIIPTYRRPADLERCLGSLKEQERPANEILLTVRDTDGETRGFLDRYEAGALPLRTVTVTTPGVIAAMNQGVSEATGDIIALIDDDTAPFPDWLLRIEACFAEDVAGKVGGVGGRDWQPKYPGNSNPVGLVSWYGRFIGNHHLGSGEPRFVDVLKGANCAYRAEPLKAVGFDERLAGGGAQVNWELALGLALRRAGWQLIYDPAVAVNHFIAQRFDNDLNNRGIFSATGQTNAVHNETLILWSEFSPIQRAVYLAWALCIGTRGEPGLMQLARLALVLRERFAVPKWRATLEGRLAGLKTWQNLRGKMRYPARPLPSPSSATQWQAVPA